MTNSFQLSYRVCIVWIAFISAYMRISGSTASVCTTQQCQKLGNIYRKNMNEQAKPCTNFYDYVCHGWKNQNPRPKYEGLWDVERSIEYRIMEKMKQLLESKETNNVRDSGHAKKLFAACMKLPSFPRHVPADLRKIISAVGNWPMLFPTNKELPTDLHWWEIDNQYIRLAGESSLFHLYVSTDLSRIDRIVTEILRPQSPYGMLIRTMAWTGTKDKEHYKQFLIQVIQSMASHSLAISKAQINKDLRDVFTFREKLREMAVASKNDDVFEQTSIRKFQLLYNKHAGSQETAKINWLEVVRSVYPDAKDPHGYPIQNSTSIITQTNYIIKLARILDKTPKRVIVNHVHLYFVERHILLNLQMQSELEQSIVDDSLAPGKIRYDVPRWITCIVNNVNTVLGAMYVASAFPENYRTEVKHLVLEAKRLLRQQILESDWVDENTKLLWAEKLDRMESMIGYPDWYKNPSAPHTDLDINPLKADAYYSTKHNKLYVSGGYLQWPIFTPNMPYVISYGSTVAMLGHELQHAFDDSGLLSDMVQNRTWWSRAMYQQFTRKSVCFNEYYQQQKTEQFQKLRLPLPSKMTSTVSEDIADVMGLKLAYKGYKQKFAEENGSCKVLPGFEKFSCDKLFFIAFANTFCSDFAPVTKNDQVLVGRHSIPEIRVNGAVGNMKEFSTVFGCTEKDPLHLKKRCDIWKN